MLQTKIYCRRYRQNESLFTNSTMQKAIESHKIDSTTTNAQKYWILSYPVFRMNIARIF